MKVRITKNSKKAITLEEASEARQMIIDLDEYDYGTAEYAALAVRAICGSCEKVYEATAEISKNCRVWNRFTDKSGNLDVWIRFVAKADYKTMIEGAAYLSDIWDITGRPTDAIKYRSYKKIYKTA